MSHNWQEKKNAEFGEPNNYAEMSKEERKALRKEYCAKHSPNAKMWQWLTVGIIVAAVGALAYAIVMWALDSNPAWMWFISFIIISATVFPIVTHSVVYGKFRQWLEYEKNIIKK